MKTFEGHEDAVNTLVVWNDSLFSGDDSGKIKQWNHEGVCVNTWDAGSAVYQAMESRGRVCEDVRC